MRGRGIALTLVGVLPALAAPGLTASRLADVLAVPAPGQDLSELGCDDPAPADRRVTQNANVH